MRILLLNKDDIRMSEILNMQGTIWRAEKVNIQLLIS